jgi:hypothetical protein
MRHLVSLMLLSLSGSIVLAQKPSSAAVPAQPIQITFGSSVVPLNGPWKFHTGDNPLWASPGFDDSTWETVDLTPKAGAHDDDVGLTGYVSGWTVRGHAHDSGYAWYRIRLDVTAPQDQTLALTGPPAVDNTYQAYFNGHLLGGIGNFASPSTPTIYSIQPRLFPLPHSLWAQPTSGDSNLIAIRVWMAPWMLRQASDVGGIHIAPALGEITGIKQRYHLQWLQTVTGYIVDAVEPILFIMLAIMACSLIPFDPTDTTYLWIATALILSALARANQNLFFWTQLEDIRTFDVVRNVLLTPLCLGAWAMAWRTWLRLRYPATIFVVALTSLYILAQLFSRAWLSSIPVSLSTGFHTASNYLRLIFVVLLFYTIWQGLRSKRRETLIALPAILLVSIGLFAQELSELHITGIWFPFGTGVSRTQYAYAVFCIPLFAILLHRLLHFAHLHRRLAPPSDPADEHA